MIKSVNIRETVFKAEKNKAQSKHLTQASQPSAFNQIKYYV